MINIIFLLLATLLLNCPPNNRELFHSGIYSSQLLNLAEERTCLGPASQLVPRETQAQGNGLGGLAKFSQSGVQVCRQGRGRLSDASPRLNPEK